MRAFLLVILILASLFWIGYAGFSLNMKDKLSYHPEYVFNVEDSSILIINRQDELANLNQLLEDDQNPYIQTFSETKVEASKLYFSKNRPLVVLEKNARWSSDEIAKISLDLNLSEKELKNNNGNFICLSKSKISLNENPLSFLALNDKNASANIVSFKDDVVNTDVYQTNDGNYKYISKSNYKNLAKAIDDQLNFAYLIPEDVKSYTFFERSYLEQIDSVFKKGPMFSWMDKGMVTGSLNGQSFIVSDYQVQQNPILILQELSKELDTNFLKNEIKMFQGFQLTNSFPSNSKNKFYVLELEDKVVLAESKQTCQQLALHFKLGKTLSLNIVKKERVYKELTKEVHFRQVKENQARSLSMSDKQSFAVVRQKEKFVGKPSANNKSVLTVNFTGKISNSIPIYNHLIGSYSFFTFLENGSYALISKEGKVLWKGKFEDAILDVDIVDVYLNNKQQIAVLTENQLNILDLKSNEVNGFPVLIESKITTGVCNVEWRGQSKFIFGTEKGELVMLDARGRELLVQKVSDLALEGEVIGLNRSGTLNAYVSDGNKAFCVEMEKTKLKRNLAFLSSNKIKKGSEVISAIKEGESYVLNNLSAEKVGVLSGQSISTDDHYFYTQNNGVINVYSAYGDLIKSINKSNQEISKIETFENQGEYYTLILDNLENNIYLFNNEGGLVSKWPVEGQNVLNYAYDVKTGILTVVSVLDNNLIIYSSLLNS